MSSKTYVITARIEIDIRNGVPLGGVLQQMQQQILSMQHDPNENASGDADWWVDIRTSDAQVSYENVGDSLAAEAGKVSGWEREALPLLHAAADRAAAERQGQ